MVMVRRSGVRGKRGKWEVDRPPTPPWGRAHPTPRAHPLPASSIRTRSRPPAREQGREERRHHPPPLLPPCLAATVDGHPPEAALP